MGHWFDRHWIGVDAASGTVATPTLAWTDAANGTGGTVAISGTTEGSTNTVYTQSFAGDVGTSTWTSRGSRTGDGNLTVTLSAGHYLLYCKSVIGDEAASSTIHYVKATTGNESVEYQCLTAIQARLAMLTLSGIDAADIVIREVPAERNLTLPAIVVAPQRPTHGTTAGTNNRDDITYAVYVAIFAADNQALTANTATYTKWLEQIAKAFRNQRLSAVAESVICTVEPVDTVPWGAWTDNLFAGGMLIRCVCRETRGLS